MADEIKVKITREIGKVETPQKQPHIRRKEFQSFQIREKTEISDEAKILTEFVPKVLASIDRVSERESKPASNSEIASALIEELVKSVLAKKIKG